MNVQSLRRTIIDKVFALYLLDENGEVIPKE